MAVKHKFDSLPQPKDGKKKSSSAAKNKKKPENKKKKKAGADDEVYRDTFLPLINLERRASYSTAEAMLARSVYDADKVVFRPVHVWTEQDTTEKLLEKKETARDRFGWEIDFDDYKIPLMKNAMKKLDKLET